MKALMDYILVTPEVSGEQTSGSGITYTDVESGVSEISKGVVRKVGKDNDIVAEGDVIHYIAEDAKNLVVDGEDLTAIRIRSLVCIE